MTILVDSSASTADKVNGVTTLGWIQQAVNQLISSGVTDSIGLWSYSSTVAGAGYRQLVTTGLLPQTVNGTTRSKALTSAVTGLVAGGDRTAYAAMIAADPAIAAGVVAGRTNLLVVITTGADQTPHTPRTAVLSAISPHAKALPMDVIGVGAAVPSVSYAAIAQAGGGTYTGVTDASTLPATLVGMITAIANGG